VRGQAVRILGLRWDEGDGIASDLARRDRDDFTILLAHHPDAFDAAAQADVPLTLAGHTHGGQLMLTPHFGFGPWLYRYWSGLYRKGASQLVVSNGVGNWFPLRIGAPAEIIFLTLE
jgi:predicted MPP superfamily phosphohydrolase